MSITVYKLIRKLQEIDNKFLEVEMMVYEQGTTKEIGHIEAYNKKVIIYAKK